MTHIKSAHDKIRDHICSICQKGFAKRSVLNRHIKCVHSGEKNFVCEICGKAFVAKKNLQFHIDGLHRQLKPHQCVFCTKSFARRCDLYRHNQCMHAEKKNYNCTFCSKGFPQKWHLDRHVNAVHLKKITEFVISKSDDEIDTKSQKMGLSLDSKTQNDNTNTQSILQQENVLNIQSNEVPANNQLAVHGETIQFIDSNTGLPISTLLNNSNGQNIFSIPSNQVFNSFQLQNQPQHFQQIVTSNGTFLLPVSNQINLDNLSNGSLDNPGQTLCLIAGNDGNLFTVNLNTNQAQSIQNSQNIYPNNASQSVILNQFLTNSNNNLDFANGNIQPSSLQFQSEPNFQFVHNIVNASSSEPNDIDNKAVVQINIESTNMHEELNGNSIDSKLLTSDPTNIEDIINFNIFQSDASNFQPIVQQMEAIKPIDSNSKVFLCDFCDKYYTRKQSLSAHVLQKHSDKQPFKCLLCSKGFVRRWEFYRHVSTHHQGFFSQAVGEDRASDFQAWLIKNKMSQE